MAPLRRIIANMIHRHDHHQQSSSKSRRMHLFIVYEFPLSHSSKAYPKHQRGIHFHRTLDKLPETVTTMAVSDDIFRAFHRVDRSLYTVLVDRLGRDPAQSMQVMALWLWLERMCHDQNLAARILELPHSLINDFADEAVLILNCVESDEFLISQEELDSWYSIELTQSNVRNMEVTVPFFHRNRLMVNRGVTQLLNEVCYRAFHDLMQNARAARTTGSSAHEVGSSSRVMPMHGSSSYEVGSSSGANPMAGSSHEVGNSSRVMPMPDSSYYVGSSNRANPMAGSSHEVGSSSRATPMAGSSYDVGSSSRGMPMAGSSYEDGSSSRGNRQQSMMPTMVGNVPLYGPVPFYRIGSRVGLTMPSMLVQPADRTVDPNIPAPRVRAEVPTPAPIMFQAINSYDLRAQRQFLRDEELSALMNSMIVNGEGDEDNNQGQNTKAEQEEVEELDEVPAVERTLFITFSIGYPVTMDEVREFFTGMFGDCIEGLYPQEVRPNVQPLYARMVMRSTDVLHQILRGQVKVKYTINRRHVWARRFVPKFKPRRR